MPLLQNPVLVLAAPPPSLPRVLLVDDNQTVRLTLDRVLKRNGFHVTTASNVIEALRLITSQTFDLLLSDLHMPCPGDGLTVVSAMRHSNPQTVTLLFSAFPAMQQAATAILGQTDDILVKPMAAETLVTAIRARLAEGASPGRAVQEIATILENETQAILEDWIQSVRREPHASGFRLEDDELATHLPELFRDLIYRLRFPQPLGSRALRSPAAAAHGLLRHRQGYTAPMLVEESRMLQVSIFQTLQDNLSRIDFSVLLAAVLAIADEVESQLAQSMASYCTGTESKADA